MEIILKDFKILIQKLKNKALTPLVGRKSLSVDWENGPERWTRLFHLTINFL